MSKSAQNRPSSKKDRWDFKRIASTVFIVFISALLILLFITGDLASSCSGGAAHGVLARVNGNPVYYQSLVEEMNALQAQNQSAGQEADHEALLDQALDSYIVREVMLYGARKTGITLSEATRRTLLYRYLGQAQLPPAQFASASKSYRRDVERRINESYLCESLQADIYTSYNTTALGLRIENEVRARRAALDLVYVDVRQMAEGRSPSDEELRGFFEQASQSAGKEGWRKAASFEGLVPSAREELAASWKNETFTSAYLAIFQETESKMKKLEDGLAEGKSLALAAQEAGLPVYATAPFSWDEIPSSAGREFPALRAGEFYRQALTLPQGANSGVLKLPAEFPQAFVFFQVRASQAAPKLDMDLLSNRAELEKLPAARQEELRQSFRTLVERHTERGRFALFQEAISFLYADAKVTKTPRDNLRDY